MKTANQDLVLRLASRNEDERESAYREVISQYRNLVYAVARRFTLDPGLADDIYQESFLRLFRSIGSLRNASAFPGFFRRIILNTAQDVLSGGREFTGGARGLQTLAYEFDASYLDLLFLIPHLDRLPAVQREILKLEFWEGLTPAESAHRLGLTPTQVRVYRHRALRKMRALLEREALMLSRAAHRTNL